MILPRFVQSRLLMGVPGAYHAFLGVDPVPGRGREERLRTVFSIPPSRIGLLKQVHSAAVLELEEGDLDPPGSRRREGDALWTAVPGTGVGIHSADCVPVLVAHASMPVVAAVHAGWRGLVSGIVGEAVRAVAARFGGEAVDGLVGAAGPSARGCCYEVGEEVADLVGPLPGGAPALRKGAAPGKWTADLRFLATEALAAAGVRRDRIGGVGPCTVCSPAFHSYRREKSLTGRQLSFIYII